MVGWSKPGLDRELDHGNVCVWPGDHEGNPCAVGQAPALVDIGGQAAGAEKFGDTAGEVGGWRGRILDLVERWRKAAEIMNGLVGRRRANGGAQALPMRGDHQDRLGAFGKDFRQAGEELARLRILDREHGGAVGDEDRWQHEAKVEAGACCIKGGA